MSLIDYAREIKRKASELGFLGCGIIPTNVFDDYKDYLDKRVKSFPESKQFYERLYDNVRQPENFKTIIVCTQRYNNYKEQEKLKGLVGKCYLFDPRIPYSKENRATVEFEAWLKLLGLNVMQGKTPARLAAAKAGLGKIGRNNFFYDEEHGSYVWIITWVVDKVLEYDDVKENYLLPACNDSCQKCVSSCPTNALLDGFSMNMGKCITQLTCYSKAACAEELRPKMGLWLYGCDECQDACPCNNNKFREQEEYPLLKEHEEYLNPERLLEMDEDSYENVVNPRFWYIGKDNLWLWKCNVLRYMVNAGDKKYHSLVKKYCDHEDQRLKDMAQWGARKLDL